MKTLTPPALCEYLALIRDSLEGRIEDRGVIDQAIGEIRLKYALTREPAPAKSGAVATEAEMTAMVDLIAELGDGGDGFNAQSEPAPCPHRCASCGALLGVGGKGHTTGCPALREREPALCAAPGEAGEWALIVNSVGQVTYNVRLERGWTYELRADGVYRRRAPEAKR